MDNNINLLTVRRAPADRSATKTGFQRLPRLPQLLASKVSQREHLLGKIIAAQKHMFKTGALSRPRMERGRRQGREEGKGWRRKGRREEGKGKGKEEGEGGEKGRRGWGGLGEVTGNGKEGRTEEGEKEENGGGDGKREREKGGRKQEGEKGKKGDGGKGGKGGMGERKRHRRGSRVPKGENSTSKKKHTSTSS